ncbi:MAG: ABC transporter ATP-binding protein/permease [Eubacteriales bacterium]|nr:ABC transporter ATP-binding protein/permease [Eubacteriales bacterium]
MLILKRIVKDYLTGETKVAALKGIDLEFRKSEFVCILGPSGCGKTTMLNIIGGLDQYTSGDLIVNGKSTKQFNDRDWDIYRNNSIGFVFQNYNLIPHQTVLSNVELALTLSGVSKSERRKRATEALKNVGLEDQLHKKPNQMSGGQMQRVAIARALVNNPDILLADEPTGALDSQTSTQVMDILKEISKEKLIIMVTHNSDIAERYSTRTINVLDGMVTGDSNPYHSEPEQETIAEQKKAKKKRIKKKSMSFITALSLSLNNLMTKKTRTIMTGFAGSIGIIGIALILSVSTGVQSYINTVERDTMSSYPLTITETTMDTTALMTAFIGDAETDTTSQEENRIYSNDIMFKMMDSMTSGISTNNLTAFKAYIESDECDIDQYVNDIKYSYATGLNVYLENDDGSYTKGLMDYYDMYESLGVSMEIDSSLPMMGSVASAWQELIGDDEYIKSQYSLLYGSYPSSYDEVVLIVDENNQVTDYTLYSLGILDINNVKKYLEAAEEAIKNGTENSYKIEPVSYSFEELCEYKFRVLLDSDYYNYNADSNIITECNDIEIAGKIGSGLELKLVGIMRASEDSTIEHGIGAIGYTAELMKTVVDKVNNSDVVTAQRNHPDTDLFTGIEFGKMVYTPDEIRAFLAANPEYASYAELPDEMLLEYASTFMTETATYDKNMKKLGGVDKNKPYLINLYPKDFESKEAITKIISDYNANQVEENKITYTDTIALMMSSVTTIINAISYVLMAFVAISLVVSSIMIGIITYISVLERTKEIGILRAIGASKKDISRVFNAETLIIGFVSGTLGIAITLLLLFPINAILHVLTGIETLSATLPVIGGLVLVVISMCLTFIAGLIPSRIAAKKDPVIALRTE